AFGVDEAGQHVERIARGLAALEWNEDDLVAAARLAVPRAVLSHEHPVLEARGERRARGVGEAERRGVRPEGVVRRNRLGHELRVLWLGALVDVLAVVAERPAVEGPVPDRR